MNALTINILIIFIVFSILPGVLNYFILENNIKYGIFFFFLIVYTISFITGYIISYYSGHNTCNNSFNRVCLWKAFKQAFYSTSVYCLIFFVPFFKSGFIGLMGNTFFINSLSESVIMILTNVSLTIDNYFRSIKDNCKLDFDLSTTAWRRIEKKLNSRKKKKIKDLVEIKP